MTAKESLRAARHLNDRAAALLAVRSDARNEAHRASQSVIDEIVRDQLAALPIDALEQTTAKRLRTDLLQQNGFRFVAQIRAATPPMLEAIKGIGPVTAQQLLSAAAEIDAALHTSAVIRFDVEARPAAHAELLVALARLERGNRAIGSIEPQLRRFVSAVEAELPVARLQGRPVRRLFAGPRRRDESEAALHRLEVVLEAAETERLADRITRAETSLDASRLPDAHSVWRNYLVRPIEFNTLLAELTGVDHDTAADQGFLTDDIVERITAVELDQRLLDVSLRGYQAFGAKFALAQVRTILGDEMGLGKTIEALAVLCHLRASGHRHFLVISPASVLVNWQHEIVRHTALEPPHVLHGPDRDTRRRAWLNQGGIALTTFGTLSSIPVPDTQVSAVIVDEAHYVKNPRAQRTQALARWLGKPSYTLLMSGTPMENRIDEFQALVELIRPDVAELIDPTAGIAGAEAFRRTVAPVYLRRNQSDVLSELPPRIETAEWLTLEGEAARVYRDAVAEGSFMKMRRAAFLTEATADSPKLERLLELVYEAVANNRKVVVFSYFLDVIDRVCLALGGMALEPLTGAVPSAARQELVDRFSGHLEPVVLVSQIEAGGVGLNIQAASVVILAEPQWKPSTEDQAIARCHRMGQVRPVEVHRLLTENSVDEHMVALLARKSELFAGYAAQSALRDATPEAIDVTAQAEVRDLAETLSDAQAEELIITRERLRLGV